MWHHHTLTIPAGTPESSPVSKDIALTYGVITYIAIGFPAGCKQLVKARVYHAEHQIFPNNPDEPACWDGGIEGGDEHYLLVDEPYGVVVRGYAPSAAKNHDITILINVLPLDVAEPWTAQISTLDKIKNVFGLS